MKRAIILLALFATVLSINTISASALVSADYPEEIADPGGAVICWVNVNTIDLDIVYSGNTASCSGRIRGKSDVNSITATFTLRRVNANGTTTLVSTWSGLSSSTNSLNFSGTYSPVSVGETYRLSVTATLTTTSGVSETVSHSFDKKY